MGSPFTDRIPFAMLAAVSVLAGCLSEGSGSKGERRIISAALRAGCPENPLIHGIPEDSQDTAAGLDDVGMTYQIQTCPESDSLHLELDAYDNDGLFVNGSRFALSAGQCRTLGTDSLGRRNLRIQWDYRNRDGGPVPSGYYFLFISSESVPLLGPSSKCIFVLWEKDLPEPK